MRQNGKLSLCGILSAVARWSTTRKMPRSMCRIRTGGVSLTLKNFRVTQNRPRRLTFLSRAGPVVAQAQLSARETQRARSGAGHVEGDDGPDGRARWLGGGAR